MTKCRCILCSAAGTPGIGRKGSDVKPLEFFGVV